MTDTNESPNPLPRREFLERSLGALGAVGLAGALSSFRSPTEDVEQSRREPMIEKGHRILFQGDSITDAGRKRDAASIPNMQPGLGHGYAWLAASQLLVTRPEAKLEIFNRGISGHKVFQLAERWDKDCIELKPYVLSILIGVNDIWHKRSGKYDGTVEVYERDYDALLSRTREALPEVKLVICEPFVLRCGAIDDSWFPEFDEYRAAAARVAKTHGTVWVPFQTLFDEATKYAPAKHWAADGVHPSAAGASLMAYGWLRAVGLA
jgi:lysophospholipase L1-like esterase